MTRSTFAFFDRTGLAGDAALAVTLAALSASLAPRFVRLVGVDIGPVSVLLLLPFVALVLLAICHGLASWMRTWPPLSDMRRPTILGNYLLGLFLLVSFAVLYPVAHSGLFGPGSDRDDALQLACADLSAGRSPFSRLTYLGNPVTAMPGELFLALPFSLTGCVAVQNFFWMTGYWAVLVDATRRFNRAMAMLWLLLLASPEVLREYVTGGDQGTAAIMVLCSVYVLLKLLVRHRWWWLGAAVLLGLALSSRPIYLMLIPLFAVRLFAVAPPVRAALSLALVLGAFALVTLPFYLADPAGFTPLTVAGKLGMLREYLPYADVGIYSVTAVAALIAASVWAWRGETAFYWSCGAVAALPLILGEIVLTVFGGGGLHCNYLPYLHVAVYFFAVAWAIAINE
jgi:hypothetical protein